MAIPTTTLRIDEDVKRQAKPILDELGLNISSATNIFLKAVIRCNGIPFDLHLASPSASVNANDFIADYLAPMLSKRNERLRVGYNPTAFRNRLIRRKQIINQGRRSIA